MCVARVSATRSSSLSALSDIIFSPVVGGLVGSGGVEVFEGSDALLNADLGQFEPEATTFCHHKR
jgi:hypothetical protein